MQEKKRYQQKGHVENNNLERFYSSKTKINRLVKIRENIKMTDFCSFVFSSLVYTKTTYQ